MRPKRPRSHQLEQEAIVAFRKAIPTDWVFRELGQDYGIDGEVEIFDQAGEATGIKFLVQLKATDEKDKNKALSVIFSKATAEYFSSFDIPVLVVRYQAPADKVFVRWFHTFDPYYGRKYTKFITFKFEGFHEWSSRSSLQIIEEIQNYREVGSPSLKTPVPFQFIADEKALGGASVNDVVSKLRQEADKLHYLITINISKDSHKAVNRIELSKEKIAISLAGMNGYTLHTPEGYPPHLISQTLHFDILAGIALSFYWHGHSSIGARLISEVAQHSHIKSDLRTITEMSSCLASAGYFSQAMALSDVLFDDENLINNAQLLMTSILLRHRDKLSTSEKEYAYSVLQKMAEKAEILDHQLASAIQYNCGNLLVSNKRYVRGVSHYRKAAKLEPDYYNRFYFWKELAGVFFETGHFDSACRAYNCCLDLDSKNTKIQPFYADSLMFAGHYKQAQDVFTTYIQQTELTPHDSEWQLKNYALGFLLDILNIDHQKRNEDQASKLFNKAKLDDHDKLTQIVQKALTYDALCSLAWYNMGIISSKKEDWSTASIEFLFAALTNPYDIEAWFNCLAAAHKLEDHNLFSAAFFVAYQYNVEDFIRFFGDNLHSQANQSFSDHLNQISRELMEILKDKGQQKEVRIHRPEGGFDLLVSMERDS